MENHLIKYRRPLIVLTHIALISISYLVAFYMRFEFAIPELYFAVMLRTLPILVLTKVVIFYFFGLYSGLWSYVSIHDLVQILKANILATACFCLFLIAINGLSGYPRSVFILDWLLCVAAVSGIRFINRALKERDSAFRVHKNVKVLVVGAGKSGILVLKELVNNTSFGVVGFVDDDPAKTHMHIQGVKVLGAIDDIKKLVIKYDIEEIIIAIPSASGQTMRNIVSKCEKAEVKIKTAPGFHKILTGDITVNQIRDVRPEDLLGRETVEIDTNDISAFLNGKVVLVTGAAGSIGSELCRQIARFNPDKIVLYDYNENDIYFLELELKENCPNLEFITIIGDIKDIGLLKRTFTKYKPQVVFHSAAHKHVPLMEKNPVAAVKNNIIGTRNFMYAAEHYGVESFVMISTDKAVNPTSIMGASKRIAEMIIQTKAGTETVRTKFMAVRFGNVIGSSGSAVPIFKKQIEKGGPVTVTDPDVKRYFMSPSEAAQLVIQAGTIGKGGEVFILDMGEQIKISDLARNLITLSGLEVDEDIEIKYIGMRPGEKMHEEMLLDTEHDKATKHNRIYITQPETFNSHQLRREVKQLEKYAKLMNEEKIIAKIKEMVPSYNPNNTSKGK